MLQPDHYVESALQVALERMQGVVSQLKDDAAKIEACLRALLRQIATSSQVTPEQSIQFQQLLTLLEAAAHAGTKRSRRGTPCLIQHDDKPEVERGRAYGLVNVRDINLICQEYEDVYALVEGKTRRRKINWARRRQGVLEVRTAARDEWKGPVTWMEWMSDLGMLAELATYTGTVGRREPRDHYQRQTSPQYMEPLGMRGLQQMVQCVQPLFVSLTCSFYFSSVG